MNPVHLRHVSVLTLVAALAACSPALNWREVALDDLVVLLPCKPDQATRTVQLGAVNGEPLNTSMKMSGCEAGGALYAVSHVHVADVTQAAPTQAAWRLTTLASLQASAIQVSLRQSAKTFPGQSRSAVSPPGAPSNDAPVGAYMLETLNGKRPDRKPVQAQLVWMTKGQDIYHVAVYGPKLDKEMTELLFSELRLP